MAAAAWDLERKPAGTRPAGRSATAERPRLRSREPSRAAAYRRRRLIPAALTVVVAITLLLVGMSSVGSGATAAAGVGAANGVVAPVEVVVSPGDTIWDLAHRHAPAGQDPRAYVVRILEINDLDATALLPGKVVRLP